MHFFQQQRGGYLLIACMSLHCSKAGRSHYCIHLMPSYSRWKLWEKDWDQIHVYRWWWLLHNTSLHAGVLIQCHSSALLPPYEDDPCTDVIKMIRTDIERKTKGRSSIPLCLLLVSPVARQVSQQKTGQRFVWCLFGKISRSKIMIMMMGNDAGDYDCNKN